MNGKLKTKSRKVEFDNTKDCIIVHTQFIDSAGIKHFIFTHNIQSCFEELGSS